MRKVLLLMLAVFVAAAPAYADFAALERGQTAGRIIYSVSDNAYLAKSGQAITEEAISGLSSRDYGKTGLVADGNTRLILRYKSSEPGTVAFSVSPSIAGAKLESFTTRQSITAPLSTVSTSNGDQVSAVFVAPESWPENITYPRGTFTVTATFTPSSGGTSTTESLTLTLQATPVVLIHGMYSNNEDTFGYNTKTKSGVWPKLESAGLTVASWNYANTKAPKTLIANNTNCLAKIIADTLNTLNASGIAATRVDLVTHGTGGISARQFLRNDIDTGNKTANSYGQGTVRRVVTIGSPNRGTPIASFLAKKFDTLPASWQNWAGKSWWESVGYTILKVFALKNAEIDDVALGSSYIAGLGYPGIPFHAIYGKVKSDNAKFNQLFDDVVSGNTVNLSKIDWLPQQFVDLLTSSKGQIISTALSIVSEDVRLKELLGAFYGDEDHDLVVSETSARDIFPANAVSSFEGLATHNHIMLGLHNDVAERVLALLKGGTSSFSELFKTYPAQCRDFASMPLNLEVACVIARQIHTHRFSITTFKFRIACAPLHEGFVGCICIHYAFLHCLRRYVPYPELVRIGCAVFVVQPFREVIATHVWSFTLSIIVAVRRYEQVIDIPAYTHSALDYLPLLTRRLQFYFVCSVVSGHGLMLLSATCGNSSSRKALN